MLGLGLGITGVRGLWSPARLFGAGQSGHWSGGYDPALGRLWQDSAGVTPVTAPVQTVGLVSRYAGTADASQATALSRPTLARRPRGGRRNLLVRTEDAATWSGAGVTVTGGQADPIGGSGAIRVQFSDANQSCIKSVSGITTSATVMGSIYVKGSAGQTIRSRLTGNAAQAANHTLTGEWQRISATGPWGVTVSEIDISTYSYVTARDVMIWAPQVELGSVATAYQGVVSANDITEAGNNDVWHLLFDGVDDALSVTLPAGTYGRARVSDLGVVTVDSVTDPTSISWGSATRVADFILRQGAFSAAEIAALTADWEGLYK